MEGIQNFFYYSPKAQVDSAALDKRVAKTSCIAIAQLAAAYAVNAAIFSYGFLPVTLVLSSALIKSVAVYLSVEIGKYLFARINGAECQMIEERVLSNCQRVSEFSLLNVIAAGGVAMAVHEMGHYLAASILFREANAKISISPFQSAHTTFDLSAGLSFAGRLLGMHTSFSLLLAAGLLATTITATTLYVAARYLKSHPDISSYVKMLACAQMLADISYGVLSLLEPEKMVSGDFWMLHCVVGIHPSVTIALMLALPLAAKAALDYCRY